MADSEIPVWLRALAVAGVTIGAVRSLRGARLSPGQRTFLAGVTVACALLVLAVVLAACAPRAGAGRDPAPMPRVVTRAEWGARGPVLPTKPHVPVRLTIHHTATTPNAARPVGQKLKALQEWSQRDDSLAGGRRKPAWPDVPYHYYVGADGAVGEGREWRWVGDSNTPYDPTGHLLVVVEGNFERDTLLTAQREALYALVPALARRHGIPADSLAAHRDFARTSCPGHNLYAELPALRARVAATR